MEPSDFTKLIAKIKEDGLEVIYDEIKPKITERMFEEFKSLYREGKADASFTGLINAGVCTNLENLNQFQEQGKDEQERGGPAGQEEDEPQVGPAFTLRM